MDFLTRCCDAGQYLRIAASCAESGECYDRLRPMGIVLWYAIPTFLGIQQSAMIYVHWAMLLLSVALSVRAFAGFVRSTRRETVQGFKLLVATIASGAIHTFFFLPVIHHSLADAPAGLFLLIGAWCLIIANFSMRHRFLLSAIAGGAFGLAAWMRAFYLYPLLGMLLLAAGFVWTMPRRYWTLLGLLVALIPTAYQYTETYRRLGYFSFISKEETEKWRDIHLNDPSAGYDTLLPIYGHRWPAPCNTQFGPYESIRRGYLSDAACLYAGKLNFYLGSYAPDTYIKMYKYQGLLQSPDELDSTHGWRIRGLRSELNTVVAPDNEKAGDTLFTTRVATDGVGTASAWADNLEEGDYTFSVYLWSDVPETVGISLFRRPDNTILDSKVVNLSQEPTRFAVGGRLMPYQSAGLANSLGVQIGKVGKAPISMGTENNDSFHAWGAKLEQGQLPTPYVARGPVTGRIWSPLILAANILMIVLTIVLLVRPHKWRSMESTLALTIIGLSFAQGLLIVPEQRFAISFQVFTWLAGLAALVRPRVQEEFCRIDSLRESSSSRQ